jgi:hypothetical protein
MSDFYRPAKGRGGLRNITLIFGKPSWPERQKYRPKRLDSSVKFEIPKRKAKKKEGDVFLLG